MLEIIIPSSEQWDEVNNEFISTNEQKLVLEHSLISLAKWESKWKKPFLSNKEKTEEETIDYIKCMSIAKPFDDKVYNNLSNDNIQRIKDYINDPMTATWFAPDKSGRNNGEQVTAELIYYWMISLNIPLEWEKRHLNRLITLIKVCSAKNQPGKKMSKRDIANQNAALNAARRNRFKSKG